MEGIGGEHSRVTAGRTQATERPVDIIDANRCCGQDAPAFDHLRDAGTGSPCRGASLRIKSDSVNLPAGRLQRDPGKVTAGCSSGGTGERTRSGFTLAGSVLVIFAEQ